MANTAAPDTAMTETHNRGHALLDDALSRARAAGADEADAVFLSRTGLSASQRLGRSEALERSESHALGLRVIVNHRQACVSSSDLTPGALGEIARRGVAMARAAPEDPYCALAPTTALATRYPDLDLDTDVEPTIEDMMDRAGQIEAGALAVEGVTNSEGAQAQWTRTHSALAASNGFRGHYISSQLSVVVSVLAGEGTAMERDYEFRSVTRSADMEDLSAMGHSAGDRAVRRLNPRKVDTCDVPVVFHPRVANSLLSHLSEAINGHTIALGTSFLHGKRGEKIFPTGINVIDDPVRRHGPRSRPYDSEGLPTRRQTIVADGVLTSWLLDLSSARRLGLDSTGHAVRTLGTPPAPAPSSLYFEAGTRTPQDMLAPIDSGLYVTELMGSALSLTSGDYSRGASGFWIRNGEICEPVSGVTVAGNLTTMFANLELANDLDFRFGIDSPTAHVGVMRVAGR